jgi:sec-independent protein translocase protein TatA
MPNGWEWAVLLVIALLLFAGSRLSGVGRNVGRSIREFNNEVSAAPLDEKAAGQVPVSAEETASPELDVASDEVATQASHADDDVKSAADRQPGSV